MVSGVSSLCQMVSGGCLCIDKYFQGIRCYSNSTVKPLWSSGKTLAANAGGGRGFELHWSKICFSHFILFRVKCEELFCITNIKLLKLILNY